MQRLPSDYSRCANENCPMKENCLRWTDRIYGYSFTQFNFITNEKFSTCENQIKEYGNHTLDT